MPLKQELANWDGKSSDDIRAIYDHYAQRSTLMSELIEHGGTPALQKGATWLIKRHIESGGFLNEDLAQRVLALLPKLDSWESKLHLLQCLPRVAIPKKCRKPVESFTRQCIVDENKFVRAWAYGGFYELARQFPEYQDEATQLMEMGQRDEPASVQARIRRVMAKGF